MMVLFFLCIPYFYGNYIILVVLIIMQIYASYDFHLNTLNFFPRWDQTFTSIQIKNTEGGHVCLWEYRHTGSRLLHILNSCYHIVGSVSFWDLNLSRYGHGEETYLSRYFPRARNPPKWVLATGKNPSTIVVKETFHVDPRSLGDLAEKSSQNSSHACQIVTSKRNNN